MFIVQYCPPSLANTAHRACATAPPRRFVDEQDATLWTLKAEQGKLPGSYTRPKLWETAENAQALDWIGPEDGFGVTKDVQVGLLGGAGSVSMVLRDTAARRRGQGRAGQMD